MRAKETNKLKKGMKVKVYSDPFTKKEFEGTAVLSFHESVSDRDHLQFWSVKFSNDSGWFTRWIDPVDAETGSK